MEHGRSSWWPSRAAGGATGSAGVGDDPPVPRGGLLSLAELRRRGEDPGGRPAGGRARRAVPVDHRPGLAGPRAARLEDALPDPRPADRGGGWRPDLIRVPPGARQRPDDDCRGAARPDPGLGLAPRGYA